MLQFVKLYGRRGGIINRDYFNVRGLARYNIPQEAWDEMLAAAENSKAIAISDAGITINNWNRYQQDPTIADRVRKYREKHVTDVTVTPECNGCNADRTGRDGTLTGQDTTREDNNTDSCTEPISKTEISSRAEAPPVLLFPVKAGKRDGVKEWGLTAGKVAEYTGSFPGIDVLAELRKALQWCRDNSAKQKTGQGMPRFLGSWLSKANNLGTASGIFGHQEKPFKPVTDADMKELEGMELNDDYRDD